MSPDTPERLGDKDLPFKKCEGCGARDHLYAIGGELLCKECLAE